MSVVDEDSVQVLVVEVEKLNVIENLVGNDFWERRWNDLRNWHCRSVALALAFHGFHDVADCVPALGVADVP